ncbi:MAG: peptidylprolyl isomerase [Spirochaetes bacterium]|nr:MAG: peptidylprolyl isomerase [Spirochaetota bacterium]
MKKDLAIYATVSLIPFILFPLFASCSGKKETAEDKVVSDGTVALLHYEGRLRDGTVFDSTEGDEPREFLIGAGLFIPGFEDGVKGLKPGDKKEIEIKAEDAYGSYMEEAVQEVPRESFPEDTEIEVGMQFTASTPGGFLPVKVVEVKENSVVVDFNHPLAGEDLIFEVEVVDVRKPTEDELEKLKEYEEIRGQRRAGS